MALAALPFDLVWSSCSDSYVIHSHFKGPSLFLYSFNFKKKKKTKTKPEAGLYLVPPRGLGVERSSSSLVGYVSKLSRTEYWFTDAGSS